ncbi:hypothetical protein BKA63DRAFT_486287 [Paraphoma chrysanthemicola]|nr:hypothetical protein BKA63DRAFT_486287 [Paraphoma chrysanthemicola]
MPRINHESYAEFPPLQWAAKQPRHYRNRPFLALTGELRNRFYQYCFEAETILVRKCSWAGYRAGEFKGLYQVCRQLRLEFRSLSLEKTVFQVSSPEACLEFLDTYHPRSGPAVRETYRGNIIIAVPEPEEEDALAYVFDVGSVLRRAAICPEIGMRIELVGAVKYDQKDSIAQLNGFINCIQDKAVSKWRELAVRLVFGVEFFAAIYDVDIRSRIHFFLKDFEEVTNHENGFFEWWSSVAEPPASIDELAVSWGYAFDGHRARPLVSGSDGRSLDGKSSEGEDSGGEDSEFGDSDSEDSENSDSSDYSLYFIDTLINLPPTLERGTYTWNADDSE